MELRFMDNKKNDKYYVEKILENVNFIIKYTKNISYEEYINDELLIDASIFRLIQIAENIKGLSEDYKKTHASIPWGLILGFRNGIVHDYGKTDYSIVYEIISDDIHKLKNELENDEYYELLLLDEEG